MSHGTCPRDSCQAAISIIRGVVRQAASELLVEGGNLAVLMFQNPEEVLHCTVPVERRRIFIGVIISCKKIKKVVDKQSTLW